MFVCQLFCCGIQRAELKGGSLKESPVPLRGRGHVSKVSACLVSTNSPLTKLLGPQWRVKWFGNKERLVLSVSLAHTHTDTNTHAPLHTSQKREIMLTTHISIGEAQSVVV